MQVLESQSPAAIALITGDLRANITTATQVLSDGQPTLLVQEPLRGPGALVFRHSNGTAHALALDTLPVDVFGESDSIFTLRFCNFTSCPNRRCMGFGSSNLEIAMGIVPSARGASFCV